jgi:hypothetical protein
MRRALALAALAALAISASLASAAEVSRSEYKASVEPICKANSEANDRILKGVRQMVKQGKLKPAGAKFIKASTALTKTYNQLKAIPQPSADEAKLGKWLGYVKTEASLFQSAGKALKASNKHKAQKFVNELTANANKANATVLSFGFHSCRFEPSKYT